MQFLGTGKLNVKGSCKNGIACDDYVVIDDGTLVIDVTSVGGRGIKVNDGITINGGTTTSAGANYINALRQRAHATTKDSYSVDQILDERSRELYYEGFRRTDLIRYGYFGGDKSGQFLWDWKAHSPNGAGFAEYLNIFALPAEDVNANPKLKQNPGY
jgi:hypothetical protein